MKNLVLGIAIAALTGCTAEVTVEPDPDPIFVSLVTVSWDFTHITDGTARTCPVGFPVARVVSQALNPTTHRPTGTTFVDDYDCADGVGTVELPDEDIYVVWVEILSNSGTLYAKSEENVVDTLLDGDPDFSVEILDDGGYFSLAWDLVDADSNAPLSCQAAGATKVEAVSTELANPDAIIEDVFRCSDHFGTTAGLRAGDYVVSVTAGAGSAVLGDAVNINNVEITAPNGLTFLGLVKLPVD